MLISSEDLIHSGTVKFLKFENVHFYKAETHREKIRN